MFRSGEEMMKIILVSILFICSNFILAGEPFIVAHRGASKKAPENTLPAFKLAWEQGADAIEADFRLSKDGHIVCIHDSDTKRVSGKKLNVSKSTLAELRKLDVGSFRGNSFKGTIIPTIEEVFSTIPPKKKIFIEVKCGIEIIPALLEKTKKSGLKDEQIVIISFKEEVIELMKSKAPQFKAFLLKSIKKDTSLKSVLATLEKIKADGLSTDTKKIDEKFVKGVLASGFQHHVWTINDVKTANRFKALNVMSITTDIPDLIRSGISEK